MMTEKMLAFMDASTTVAAGGSATSDRRGIIEGACKPMHGACERLKE